MLGLATLILESLELFEVFGDEDVLESLGSGSSTMKASMAFGILGLIYTLILMITLSSTTRDRDETSKKEQKAPTVFIKFFISGGFLGVRAALYSGVPSFSTIFFVKNVGTTLVSMFELRSVWKKIKSARESASGQ